MEQIGINMGDVKRNNRSQILKLIGQTGPISKKDIAESLGLTAAAVTQICSDFLEKGLLFEVGTAEGEEKKAGRKKVLIDLNPEYGLLLGINIDSLQTTISICNLKGELKALKTLRTDSNISAENFLKHIAKESKQLAKDQFISPNCFLGVGVGLPGLVDKQNGVSVHAYGIWNEKVQVAEILTDELQLPVLIENNVNAFALAELLLGEGKQESDLLVVKWGPGVGSSIIMNGAVFEKENGKAAELGHFIVKTNGMKCSCGKFGCLETIVSEKQLQKLSNEEYEQAILLFAQTIVNAVSLIRPSKVIFYGRLFDDIKNQENLLKQCIFLDSDYGKENLIKSKLSEKESYIGPIALCIWNYIYEL